MDVSPAAVEQARRRGAAVLLRDVFAPLPREGAWHHVLLADGNVGIGGDPLRLLHRCRRLLADGGSVLLDLQGVGRTVRTVLLRLRVGAEASEWFPWSSVPTAALPPLAAAAGYDVVGLWRAEGRWQAELRTACTWRRRAYR